MTETVRVIHSLAALPPGNEALLDWCSGVARINATREEYETAVGKIESPDSLSAKELKLLETVTHETVHFLQICTTGFLYQLAVRLLAEISDCLPEEADNVAEVIRDIPTLVPKWRTSRLNGLIDSIDTPGTHGLTVRAIAESHAFYAQKRHHYWPDLTSRDYKEMLEQVPTPDYRFAYDLAEERLGPAAFDTFPLIASLALCTVAPQLDFVELCDAAAREGLTFEPGIEASPLILALAKHASSGFLGAASRLVEVWEETHFVYTATTKRLVGLRGDVFSFPQFFVQPHFLTAELGEQASPVMVFNQSEEGSLKFPVRVPAGLWPQGSLDKFKPQGMVLLALWVLGVRLITVHGFESQPSLSA